jgi:tripartite-type tricarboxylate transporter receptor subunit TctC
MIRMRLVSAAALMTGVLAAGLGALPVGTVHAQTYPERSIRLIVPFPAGGATDTMARLVAQALQGKLGQNVVIENQGGAGGTIGARQAAFANPDGYTLLMVANSTFGTSPLLYKLDYDPVKAFVPVATAAIDRQVMVANPSVPVKTVQELVQYAKANPGKLNYGSAIGIGPHFIMELFKIKTGTDIVHVPYRGGAPMITDLLGGQIQLTVNGKSVLLPHIQAGKLRALAVTAPMRLPDLPGVPTLVELGYLDAPYDTLFGVVAPTGTPAAIIEKLNAAINDGLRSPSIQASFAKLGIESKISTPQEFAGFIAEDVPRWAAIVKLTGIKIE